MPRKRFKIQTGDDTNNDAELARNSPISIHETTSPYFSTGGNEIAGGSQGEKLRVRTCKRRVIAEKIAKDITHVTLPPPGLPSLPLSQQGHSWGPGRRLTEEFYDQDCVVLAKALLGKVLVRVVGGQRVSAKIVETEGYLGGPDAASHSSGGKRTPRNEPMYMKPGTAYVYSIYGMYHCFNVSSRGDGACVLVRAAEPLEGLEVMVEGRGKRRGATAPPLKPHQLCNGPSKLCQALALTKESANKLDLSVSEEFWLEEELEEEEAEAEDEAAGEGREGEGGEDMAKAKNGETGGGGGEEMAKKRETGGGRGGGGGEEKVKEEDRVLRGGGQGRDGGEEKTKADDGAAEEGGGGGGRESEGGGRGGGVSEDRIVVSTRIGIDSYGEEWAKKPLRFYILGNKCVSVRDKEAEKAMLG